MAVANAVSSVVNAVSSAASVVAVTAGAVAVAALRVAPKGVQKARVVLKDVRKVGLMAVTANAASAILKAAAKPVIKSARNAQPVKRERTAIQKAAPTTAPTTVNSAVKAAVADAIAAIAVTVASALHVTRSSKTLQRPIRLRWLRPRVGTHQLHRRVVRTEQPLRLARTRATAHQVSARKATVKHVVSAVSAAVAATTAGVNAVIAVNDQRARTPHPTR